MKYYEVLFFDQTGICIKSNVENPSKELVTEFLKADFENHGYNMHEIEDINSYVIHTKDGMKVFKVLDVKYFKVW
jgi:hypothetical protein